MVNTSVVETSRSPARWEITWNMQKFVTLGDGTQYTSKPVNGRQLVTVV